MILDQIIVHERRRVGYRKKERNRIKELWIGSGILVGIRLWIKELPMLYYSIFDDELI